MKWQIVLEVELDGAPADIEAVLDHVMEQLVDEDVHNPSVGASLEAGKTEIEFVVEAETLEDAHQRAHKLLSRSLNLPALGQLVGQSTRKSELIPA
jgi:hypothetical protein